MELIPQITAETREPSAAGRRRILETLGNPLFICDWSRAVFIHYEVDAEMLQREVPFELDLYKGRAYASLVAFTMRGMRPRRGGRIAAALLRPIATHRFLNLRVYVKHNGEPGIYFLAEWLPNRLSLLLGPPAFGLPYRHGLLDYRHEHEKGLLRGAVTVQKQSLRLEYSAEAGSDGPFHPSEAGSWDEFLMERYTAFTANRLWRRKFRIWHPPWPQKPVEIQIERDSLLTDFRPWFKQARVMGANYSPGFKDVWMGRPQNLKHWTVQLICRFK